MVQTHAQRPSHHSPQLPGKRATRPVPIQTGPLVGNSTKARNGFVSAASAVSHQVYPRHGLSGRTWKGSYPSDRINAFAGHCLKNQHQTVITASLKMLTPSSWINTPLRLTQCGNSLPSESVMQAGKGSAWGCVGSTTPGGSRALYGPSLEAVV